MDKRLKSLNCYRFCIAYQNLFGLTQSHSERPKEAWQIWKYFTSKSIFLITFEGGMLIRSQTTTLLQIFYEILLCSQVKFISMKVADDTFQRNSECLWVNDHEVILKYMLHIRICFVEYNFWSLSLIDTTFANLLHKSRFDFYCFYSL